MSEKVENIRNIALVSHGGAGKTSLAEAMLFDAGVITRMGRIEEGNTALDFEPEEIKRASSISTGFHQVNWKKHAITLLDTPGDQNFFSDTKTCLQAADAAVVLIDAVDGIKVQTEQAWEFLDDFKLPRVIFHQQDGPRTGGLHPGLRRSEADVPAQAHHSAAADRSRGRVQRGGRSDHPEGVYLRRGWEG